jgi:hypothetical protein
MYCFAPFLLNPSLSVSYALREYFSRFSGLCGNGCFSLSVRTGSLHPVGLVRAPVTGAFQRDCFGFGLFR